MECSSCPLAAECSANAGTASGGERVYYRGRFWSDTVWTRARRAESAGCSVAGKTEGRLGPGVAARCRMASSVHRGAPASKGRCADVRLRDVRLGPSEK